MTSQDYTFLKIFIDDDELKSIRRSGDSSPYETPQRRTIRGRQVIPAPKNRTA